MIILASTSRTRQTILTNAGLSFTIDSPRVDERALTLANPHWTPAEVAGNLALAKAIDVSTRNKDSIVIGADQVLACDGVVYYKPTDIDDCRRQLLSLRGRPHMLISALACARNDAPIWQTTQTATLNMRQFSDSFLEEYLNTSAHRVTTSVGGYQIEANGIQLFEAIDGDHFTILGLPLLPLLQYLRVAGELNT